MQFSIQSALQILERTPAIIETMLRDLQNEWTMSNEGGESWNAYDIVGHFIHGEKTDWIPRMEIILSNRSNKQFEPFDRFAQFNESKGRSLEELIEEFKRLRSQNLQLLKSIDFNEELLSRTGIHPKFGTVTLKQLLSTWVVHDLNHINQISRVMAKQYATEVGPWKEFLGILNYK